jgi:hypothetical protein
MAIEIFQGTSQTIRASVISGVSSLVGFTGHLVVKKSKDSATSLISKDASTWDASTCVFTLSYVDTSLNIGNYPLEFSIDSPSERFVIAQDTLVIKDSLKY